MVYTKIGKFNELESCIATSRAGFSWPRRLLSMQYMTNCPFKFSLLFFKTLTLSNSKGCSGSNILLVISYSEFPLFAHGDAIVMSAQDRLRKWAVHFHAARVEVNHVGVLAAAAAFSIEIIELMKNDMLMLLLLSSSSFFLLRLPYMILPRAILFFE